MDEGIEDAGKKKWSASKTKEERMTPDKIVADYYLKCMKCGRKDSVPLNCVANIDQALRKSRGYEIVEHSLVFFGVCPECRSDRTDMKQ